VRVGCDHREMSGPMGEGSDNRPRCAYLVRGRFMWGAFMRLTKAKRKTVGVNISLKNKRRARKTREAKDKKWGQTGLNTPSWKGKRRTGLIGKDRGDSGENGGGGSGTNPQPKLRLVTSKVAPRVLR